MRRGGGAAAIGLEYVLLLAAVVELSLNRLAVRTLRPGGDEAPPRWHEVLDHVGLFSQYFVSTLAIGALILMAVRLVRGPDRPRTGIWGVPGSLAACFGLVLAGLAVANMALEPGEVLSMLFQAFVALVLVLLALDQATARGDVGAKIGVVLLAVPLVLHFYPTFVVYFLGDEHVLWTSDLTFEIAEYGKWTMVLAALVSPYCFAPRPILRSATRLPPLAIGAFVGLIGAVILRQHYEVGMELASKGIGVDIGPGAPTHHIAFYLMAMGAISWTLVSTLMAPSASRRRIGVGIGLVVAGGYSFAWPFQYLLGLVGLLTISEAASRVRREERDLPGHKAPGFRAPPISAGVWQRYVAALLAELRDSQPDCKPSTATIRGEDDLSSTHVVATRRGVSVRLRVDRLGDSILCIDVLCGREPPAGAKPDWTLYARPDRLLGIRAHDEPPHCDGPARRTEDGPFDSRFRIRDGAKLTEKMFNGLLRTRATALIDGWMACWPRRCLQYRVYPGRGAPLDHPIPITELSFRGEAAAPAVDRLVTIVDLLVELAVRAGLTVKEVGSTAEHAVQALGLGDDEEGEEEGER